MSCIREETIQKYIDGETTARENSIIERHLSICEICKNKVENQRRLAFGLKNAIHLLENDATEIPIISPTLKIKNPISTGKKIIYFSAVAASLLLFALVISRQENAPIQDDLIITAAFEDEYDANRTISQQSLVLNIIDSEGNVTEIILQ